MEENTRKLISFLFSSAKSTNQTELKVCSLAFIKQAIIMQDTDPSRRPGAGPDGYAALKNHPFFSGIDWKSLRAQTPPKLALAKKVYLSL